MKYLAIDLKNAVVASIAPKVVAGQEPMETFKLMYAAVQWRYTQKASGGGQQGNTQGAWSLTKNDKSFAV